MSEQKQQNRFVPLRVRFRSSAEQAQWEREHAAHITPSFPSTGDDEAQQALNMPVPEGAESPQRTRQIKELIRLGNILRSELGLNEVLEQIVASISTCTGFRIAVINLVDEKHDYLSSVAFAGGSEEGTRVLQESHIPLEQLYNIMRPELRITQIYFISHQHPSFFSDFVTVFINTSNNYHPTAHP